MADTGAWPAGGGEAGELMRTRDWSRTPLGATERWPQSLRTAVEITLASPAPISVLWGAELVQLYNDAYAAIARERHPAIFGRPARENWADALEFLGPIFDRVMAGGPAVVVQDRRVPLRRADGTMEERAFLATFSPIPMESGAVGGIFHPLHETTPAVRTVEALRESEERLRLTLTASELGIWEHDLRTDLFHLDARAQALYGLGPVAPSGELLNRVHADDLERLGGEFQAAMDPAVRGPVSTEYRVVQADGSVRWLRVRGRVYFADGAGGHPLRGLGTVQDVTDEKSAAQALRENEERLRLALDVAGLGTWEWDLATGAGHIDARGARIVGIPAGHVPDIARAQRSAIHPDDIARVEADAAAGVERGGAFDLVYRSVHPDGSVHHVASRALAITDSEGRPVRLMGTNRDVTAEREAEAALRASEARYRTLFDRAERLQALTAALAGARTVDEVANVVVADMVVALGARTGSLAGRAPDDEALVLLRTIGFPEPVTEGVGRQPLDLRSPLVECYRTRSPIWIERRQGPDGLDLRYPPIAPVWDALGVASAAFVPLKAGGETVGVISFAWEAPREFSDEERAFLLALGQQAALAVERARLFEAEHAARAQAEAAREQLGRVFQHAPAYIATVRGPDHVFEMANPLYRQLVGDRRLVGKPAREAVPELIAQGYIEPLDQVYRTGEPYAVSEARVLFQGGAGATPQEYFFNFVYQPLTDAGGAVDGILAYGADVTAQVHARREIEAARAEAEAANRAKSEFLAVMSHELRTPLNAIGGYAELMEMGIRGPVTEQQRGDLHRIQQSQRHLLGLINEVLNYAKLESGAVHFDVEDICVRDALAAAAALVAPQAGSRGLVLHVAPCPAEIGVRADADKLRQILLNLLSNAVKFTDRGGRVEMECHDAGGRVHVRVRDTGIGIPADQLERIFEPFVQVRADLTRTAEGTGLGLAISRDLARGMGGDLAAESTVGEGSTFTLTLPRAREE